MTPGSCSSEAVGLSPRKIGTIKEFYFRHFHPSALLWFRGFALFEYPHELLDNMRESAINHHYGNWDEIYRSMGSIKPEYDSWLEKYAGILQNSGDIPIIDLGCGYGNDTLFLHERGFKVISCDYSMEALKRLNHFIDKPVIRHFDMLKGLPFENGSAKVIIANLSIHYFQWKDTEMIVEEIRRVLDEGGYLLCRVNSTKNIACYGADGVEIEENYYTLNGRNKRFFSRHHLERLFKAWDIFHIEEYSFERFGSKKVVWEIAIKKK